MKDYYKILEIDEKATKIQIKKSYHKMALKYHPDKNKDNEHLFKQAVEAYEVLYDDIKRRKYDLSRKLKQDYKFVLPTEILNFSKYFFSNENINKFTDFASMINDGLSNFSVDTKFDDLFNMLLTRIRNNNLSELYSEYRDFKKFYKVNTNRVQKEDTNKVGNDTNKAGNDTNKVGNDTNKAGNDTNKVGNDTNKVGNDTNKINKSLVKLNIPNDKKIVSERNILRKQKNIIVNVKCNLENIYNNIIKVVNLEVNEKCSICDGKGIVDKDEENTVKKNSRNRKKKNLSKKNSYNEKQICKRCSGTMIVKKKKKFTIDTNMDSICYAKSHFINYEEGYCDIIFNIVQKDSIYKRKNRYDLEINYNISLFEMYYGGYFYLNYLDNKKYKMVWNGFESNKIVNTKTIDNMGLLIDDINRGKLIINFNLVLPTYEDLIDYNKKELIEKLFNNKKIVNEIGSSETILSDKVNHYDIINMI